MSGAAPFTLRPAAMEDMPAIDALYAAARETMRRSGNPNQWGDKNPPAETLMEDIRLGRLMLLEEDGALCGAFALITGVEPTYLVIEHGSWLNSEPYVTLHRVASNGRRRGVLAAAVAYAAAQCGNVRIDTHRDNRIMQHLLEKYGFTRCGVIYLQNGSERLAYHRAAGGSCRNAGENESNS